MSTNNSGTGVCASAPPTRLLRTAGLSQARPILRYEDTYLISLPAEYLWESYQLDDQVLTNVKQHLITESWLTGDGGWDPTKVDRDKFDDSDDLFDFFSRLFITVLGYLQRTGPKTSLVKTMMHSVNVEPGSTGDNTYQPDAFLYMTTDPAPMPDKFRWRDLTCPFEYKFDDGYPVNNDNKALWSLVNIMRSDPRRMFSFGSTVQGTKFRIWLLSRAAPFTFIPFDWFDDPDSLLKFFILLAASSETDLGFDTNIKSVGGTGSDLEFTIDGRKYCNSKLLFDIGINTLTGRGTRVFEVKDEETQEVRVIRDCWIEEPHTKQMEHEIVAEIKRDMGDYQEFCKRFIDICGHRKIDTSGGFGRVCMILENGTFELAEDFGLLFLVLTPEAPKPDYGTAASVATQDHRLEQTPTKPASEHLPHPRFRYQVVYGEKGISLFEVTSFGEVFKCISQATDALHYLHQAGWVHRDLNPGNIIVVGKEVKISGLEIATQWAPNRLEELTRLGDPSIPVTRGVHAVNPFGEFRELNWSYDQGTLYYAAVEVVEGYYVFPPEFTAGPRRGRLGPPTGSTVKYTSRAFVQNPLHDYESAWWIAVWFVFHCKPEGVADSVMKKARRDVDRNHSSTFVLGTIERSCDLLPPVLQPLGGVLVEMRDILVRAYRSFEKSFDDSKMLSVFEELKPCLQNLVELAQGLAAAPPALRWKLDIEELEFDAVALERERGQQGQQAIEQEGGAEGQPMAVDDPSVGAETGDLVLGFEEASG